MSDCLFCGMISGKISTKKVYEDKHTFAFEERIRRQTLGPPFSRAQMPGPVLRARLRALGVVPLGFAFVWKPAT